MRRRRAAVVLVCILIAGCSSTSNAASPEPVPTLKPRPLVERELPRLLLSPQEASAIMGAPMIITESKTTMSDNSAIMEPLECLSIDGAAEAQVYANSGFRAEMDQSFNNGDTFTHYLKQSVVLFSYADPAAAFFEASGQQWRGCHSYTHTQSGSHWTVGPITEQDGMLSVVATYQEAAAPGWACGRALAVRRNILVDVNTCGADPADTAVRVAQEIGAKVLQQ